MDYLPSLKDQIELKKWHESRTKQKKGLFFSSRHRSKIDITASAVITTTTTAALATLLVAFLTSEVV